MKPFSGSEPIALFGATVTPQSLWVLGVTAVVAVSLLLFYRRTRTGKAMLATAFNAEAAQLMGVNVSAILAISFALSAGLGALGGILITPISSTSFGVGIMLGLKGFAAAIVGGLGNSFGAFAGGLFVGIAEAMAAGYLSSAYKDAAAFVIILLVLFVRPQGLAGARAADRV
jgi:branched-chain amino acid transport system permease protein